MQVLALFDGRLASGLLKRLRTLVLASPSGLKRDRANSETVSGEPTTDDCQVKAITQNIATFLQKFGLRDQPDVVRDFLDTCCEICVSRHTSGKTASSYPRQSFNVCIRSAHLILMNGMKSRQLDLLGKSYNCKWLQNPRKFSVIGQQAAIVVYKQSPSVHQAKLCTCYDMYWLDCG